MVALWYSTLCTSAFYGWLHFWPQWPRIGKANKAYTRSDWTGAAWIWLTHTFYGPFPELYPGKPAPERQKGKTCNLDFTKTIDSEWQWHQLGHMHVCTSLQTDNHASTPLLSFLQAWCPSCRPTNSVKALRHWLTPRRILKLTHQGQHRTRAHLLLLMVLHSPCNSTPGIMGAEYCDVRVCL